MIPFDWFTFNLFAFVVLSALTHALCTDWLSSELYETWVWCNTTDEDSKGIDRQISELQALLYARMYKEQS